MIKAEAVDQTTVIIILRGVFEDTQNVNFILGMGKKRIHKAQPYYQLKFGYTIFLLKRGPDK